MLVVMVFSFALTVAAGNGPGPNWDCDGHECYIDQGCAYDPDTGLYYCWLLKCCRDEYFYKGGCVWGPYECVSLI